MKYLKYSSGGFAILLVVALVIGYLYVAAKQPVRSGNVKLSGLREPVEVIFDRWAIPHINARHEEDAYRALGYLHAQDRLFQMEMMRRVASGRLAEILGDSFLDNDRFFRTLRIRRFSEEYVERTLPKMSQGARMALDSYLAGVNHYVRTAPTPIEFDLLGIPRKEFTPADVLDIVGLMSYNLAYGYKTDPLLTYIKNRLGHEY